MLYNKRNQFFVEKKMPMLTGLKVSSLACKSAFYGPEHNANWGGTPWNWIFKVLKCRNEIYHE